MTATRILGPFYGPTATVEQHYDEASGCEVLTSPIEVRYFDYADLEMGEAMEPVVAAAEAEMYEQLGEMVVESLILGAGLWPVDLTKDHWVATCGYCGWVSLPFTHPTTAQKAWEQHAWSACRVLELLERL